MAAGLLESFEVALDALEVTHERTTVDAFAEAVSDAIDDPAVGAPLPWDDLSLDDTAVDTDPTPAALAAAETGVTAVGAAIADEGTLVVQARPGGDEPVSLFPPRHVAVLRERDLLADVPSALAWLADEFERGPRSAVFATGPSATGDMGALVTGVHGPGAVHVVTVTAP